MAVTRAMENYLETILILTQRKAGVHAADICAELGYSRPTVSEVVRHLREKGLSEVDGENHITLTQQGRIIAEPIYERHNVLARFFLRIGVSPETAYADACKIEHEISEESFSRLKALMEEKQQE